MDRGIERAMVTVGRQLRSTSNIRTAAMSPPQRASCAVLVTIFLVSVP